MTYAIYEYNTETKRKRVLRDGIKTLEQATAIFQKKLDRLKKSDRYETTTLMMKGASEWRPVYSSSN